MRLYAARHGSYLIAVSEPNNLNPQNLNLPEANPWRPRYGAFVEAERTRFVLRSPNFRPALVLFDDPLIDTPTQEIPFEQQFGDVWSLTLPHATDPDRPTAGPGTAYGFRDASDPDADWFVDPYATAITGRTTWGDSRLKPDAPMGSAPRDKGLVLSSTFDWQGVVRPDINLRDTIVYEAHLHGLTARGRADNPEAPSAYAAFLETIPHIASLGVTTVEFLPIHHFNECEYDYPELDDKRAGLRNFWGYSSLAFFAPMSRYGTPDEFKTVVRELHRHGIEVWLDVVYNHTGENGPAHPDFSFRPLDEATFYMVDEPSGHYKNYTGCGNTVNCNHPVVAELILDSLRYWASEYQIDGFRFDLASIFCRDTDGSLLAKPPLVMAIDADPLLQGVHIIAEAWDAAGAYHVGNFPGTRWSEWNGKYRDDIRAFWAGEPGNLSALASRLSGSDDLYARRATGPATSVNFITCHDGFTLRDLVSFTDKRNLANREDNRDGEKHNHSRNFGFEGLTEDPEIASRRYQMQKNLLATLLLSHGVPMLTAGDEFGRTQQGNNNAYCQDNEIGWVDWALTHDHSELIEFVRELIRIRSEFEVLRPTEFVGAAGRNKDQDQIEWLGPEGRAVNWETDMSIGMLLHGPDGEKDLLVMINNEADAVCFEVALPNLLLCTDASLNKTEDGLWELPARSVAVFAGS